MNIQQLLDTTAKRMASDLHLLVGYAPILRVDGVLQVIPGEMVLNAEQIRASLGSSRRIMSAAEPSSGGTKVK